MEVLSATSSTTTGLPTAAPAPQIISDYQTFLVMMTTQIQNQDPLEPMNANEFAVQLATFSGVEQQVQTNDLLTGLTGQMTMMGMSQMAGWVGNEARFAAPVHFDGSTPITISPNPALAADKAVLVVKDENGNEMSRQEVPVSTANYDWLGTDAEGAPLPAGVYTLSLESYAGDALLGETEVEHYSEILEIRSGLAGTTLLVDGEIEVPSIYVTGLRPLAVPDL